VEYLHADGDLRGVYPVERAGNRTGSPDVPATSKESELTGSLPHIVDQYIQAAARDDYNAVVASFTDDATVIDDGETHRGHAEIRAWREKLTGAFEYTVEVLRTEHPAAGVYLVTTKVEGTFPGSPVELGYRFTVRGDLISELLIAP
jgi:ketosteroid isomerase-like protein